MNPQHDPGPCFYCPELPAPGEAGRLDAAQTRHAAGARRIRAGDAIGLIDGRGGLARARVNRVDRHGVSFTLSACRHVAPPNPALVVATAVPKSERIRMLLDMLGQLGVAAVVPLLCQHSTVRPRPASMARWQRVLIEACKQSRNPHLPTVAAPATLAATLDATGADDLLLHADPAGEPLTAAPAGVARVYLFVGPEGGFSDAERRALAARGARPVRLGDNTLRIETAALAGAVLALHAARSPR